MGSTTAQASTKRERAQLILRESGGIEHLCGQVAEDQTRAILELLILNEAPERAPHSESHTEPDVDTAFVRRVCSKLVCDLRYLPDVDLPAARKEEYFLRSVSKRCRQTEREREGRYDTRVPRTVGLLDEVQDQPQAAEEPAGRETPVWWDTLRTAVLKRQARLGPLLAAYDTRPDQAEDLLNQQGRFDVAKVARAFGWTGRETRRLLAQLKKEIRKVKPMVPRSFRDLCDRLTKLAATSFEGLADVEFRQELFDLSRSLSTSFAPENVDARAVKKLTRSDFDVAVDLLIDEWQYSDLPQQRTVLDRLRESFFKVRETLEAGEVEQAFAMSPRLVLDAACVQHHMSPARLQVLLAYSYFLRVAGVYDAYIRASEAILARCKVIVREKGEQVLDLEPEFESGETLRRVRTYAASNILICLFNYKYTTAPSERFQVKDYDGLASLVGRFDELLAEDPEAEFLYEELLVLRAHIARAAYNFHRTAKGQAAKERWRTERDRRRQELYRLVDTRFATSDDARTDACRLIEGTLNAAEGCAGDRTLDVVEEVMHDRPGIVGELRAERLALVTPSVNR